MADKDDGNKGGEEEELRIVGPGADEETEEEQPAKPAEKEAKAKEADEKDEDDEDDEDDEGEQASDKRVGHSETEEEDEEERKRRRREEKAERKRRQKEARERDKRELTFLRRRNEDLERRFSQVESRVARTEAATIEQRIQQIRSQIKVADQVHAKAVEKGAGEDATEALQIRDELKTQLARLENAQKLMARRAAAASDGEDSPEGSRSEGRPAERPRAPEVPPEAITLAKRWMSKNSWFKPDYSDEDSEMLGVLDSQVLRAGYDPATPEYWEELDRRVKRYLPHRSKAKPSVDDDDLDDDDDGEEEVRPRPKKKPSGPRVSTGGRERSLGKNEVYISAERKQAMIDAGVWEDPVLRKRYLQRYAEWDREHGARR